jgi:hypothetical protein
MPNAPLSLILTVPAQPIRVGEAVPLSVVVRNVSDRPLYMVGVLDGSEVGFRYPHYLPQITALQPLPPPEGLPECGNVAPLRLKDFRLLQPGEGFDPTSPHDEIAYLPLITFQTFRPPFTGRYEFRLTLSTESEQDEQWLGIIEYPGKEQVLSRLAQVPRLRIESNVATVEVV